MPKSLKTNSVFLPLESFDKLSILDKFCISDKTSGLLVLKQICKLTKDFKNKA
jgi:hypothetical protein